MTRLGRPWPILILVSCLAVAVCTWLSVGQPIRTVAAFWFFLVCPGLAVVGTLDIHDRLSETIVAVAMSIALDIGVAMVMVMARIWSPDAGLATLIGVSLLGAALQIMFRRREPSRVDASGLRAPL